MVETKINADGVWGFTLGGIVTSSKNVDIFDAIYRHEYGHYLQSQILGPAYLLVAFESLRSFIRDPYSHPDYWTETWADDLSLEFFFQIIHNSFGFLLQTHTL